MTEQHNPFLSHRSLGAQVLQATLGAGEPVFYCSPLGGPNQPARGGVPVLFPQFADLGPLAKHGLVRNTDWALRTDEATPGAQVLRYALAIGAHDHADWPHAAQLELTVRAAPDTVSFTLVVRNTGETSFSWTGGLHPYLAVPDLLACRVEGLGGLAAQDRYQSDFTTQAPGALGFDGAPFERLFSASPALALRRGAHTLHLSASGFDQWMVWNPGQSGAGALADLPAGDWQRFVCIEPVRVARPVVLTPGECFEGGLHLRLSTGHAG